MLLVIITSKGYIGKQNKVVSDVTKALRFTSYSVALPYVEKYIDEECQIFPLELLNQNFSDPKSN